ncbi:MAG: hypothetical protein WAP23_01235 [Candidatus Spechtbacterales bacterium]
MEKTRKSLSGFVFLSIFLFLGALVPLGFADANPIADWLVGSAIDGLGGLVFSVFSTVLSILVPVAAFLAGLAGSFMYAILDADLFYTKCAGIIGASPCFIDTAWTLARDLVNIALIVAIVIIALFTILGNENYGARKALIPFIIIAILINFSRVLVGVVVDISNVVMSVFVSAMPTLGDISALWKASGVDLRGNFSFDATTAWGGLLQTAVTIIFFMGMALIFAIYGVIFAVRFGALWFLTIMSPIALAAWIFPSTKKIFTFWKDQLIQWSFIGIPVLFFLWVALLAFPSLSQLSQTPEAELGSSELNNFFQKILPNLMLLILLYIAFAFGMKTSAMGSSMIINTGKKWGKTAGTATSKFAGKMAWRGAVVGARKARPIAGAGLRGAVTPPIRAVMAWRLGHALRQYKKNAQKVLIKTNLFGKMDRRNKPIDGYTPWGRLTPEQQVQISEHYRSKTAQRASAVLGAGAKGAKRLASLPFEALTPEEQKALWSVATFERLRRAKKGEVEKAMKTFSEKEFNEGDLLATITRETNLNKRLAAQILLLQNHGGNLDEKQKAQINRDAERVGLKRETLPYVSENTIRDAYKDDATKMARNLRVHTEGALKKIEDAFKSMEGLANDATRRILDTATNIHDRVAAARRLADNKALTQDDFNAFKKIAQNFDQYAQVAKRYLHFAEIDKIPDIMKKMQQQDYSKIHQDIFKDAAKFKKFYKSATLGGFAEMGKNGDLRLEIQDILTNATKAALKASLKTDNPAIHSYHHKKSQSPAGYGTDWPT